MIHNDVTKLIELLFELGFKKSLKPSAAHLTFTKPVLEFSGDLQNCVLKDLGFAMIVDISFVPTSTKNQIREYDTEKILGEKQ